MATIKRRIISSGVHEAPPKLWSNCMAVGDVVYIAGLTAFDIGKMQVVGDDMYSQAKYIFESMKHLMAAAGGVMDDIVQLRIFVTDISKNTDVWRARQEFFTGDFPSCALVEVKGLTKPELLVEIEGIAHIGCTDSTPTCTKERS